MGTIDVLPTIAAMTDTELPTDRKIDGQDMSHLLTGDAGEKRDEFLHYTSQGAIEGIRKGNYKLLVKRPRRRNNNRKAPPPKPEILLFDLTADLGEQTNLADSKPDIVAELQKRMAELDREIEQNARAPWTR